MAKQFDLPAAKSQYRRDIKDAAGKLVARTTTTERQVIHPDGTVESIKNGEFRELADGVIWDPYAPQGAPNQVGGICARCWKLAAKRARGQRRRNPVTSVAGGKNCDRCGEYTCPQHRRWNASQGVWLCSRCHRRWWWWSILRFFLFVRVR